MPHSSLDTIRSLSDRELAEANFLMLCALAERMTGHVPCLVRDGDDGMPDFIYGADAHIAWLSATTQKRESPPARPDRRPPIAEPKRAAA
jgi:hypothetical protein